MKKIIWIIGGVAVLAGVLLIGRPRQSEIISEAETVTNINGSSKPDTTTVNTEIAVSQAAQLLGSAEKRTNATNISAWIPLPDIERPVFSPAICPVQLRPVFGLETSLGYVQRKRIVQSLETDLSSQEIKALYAYLYFRPDEVGLDQNNYDALGDLVMLKLEEQISLPEDYTDHLVSVYYDTSRHDNWRDYCIQHLGTVYPLVSPEKQSMIDQLFLDAITQEQEMAGTALLAMKNAGLGSGLIAGQSMNVASSPSVPDSSRLSALHVAADANHPEALPLAREVAVSKQTVHFRMAAMAVVGKLGDTSDLPMLSKFTSSSDIRLRESSKAAVKKINTRQAQLAEK